MKSILLVLFILACSISYSQKDSSVVDTNSTVSVLKIHSPKKAGTYSAMLPGLGQIYNKKLWYVKVPILYAGLAGLGYVVQYNHSNYILYRDEYRNRLNNPDYVPTGNIAFLQDGAVKTRRDSYRKYRDLNYLMIAGLYGINIIEAVVAAHLKDFDVSDDLSMQLTPFHSILSYDQQSLGLQMRITF